MARSKNLLKVLVKIEGGWSTRFCRAAFSSREKPRMEEEKVRRIAELREVLEERARSLEAELEGLRTLLDFINDLLLEKSFKRAEEIAKPVAAAPPELEPQPARPEEWGKAVPLKTATGELLANLYVNDDVMRIVPAERRRFDVNTPPFSAFLVDRILVKMRERDQELVKEGRIMPEGAFSYSIHKDEDVLQEITIRNFDPQRERELRSAVRWTLEKMHEKERSSA